MWRLASLVVQPTCQSVRQEDCVSVDLDCPTLGLPMSQTPHILPDLVEQAPIDPSACQLPLDPVELPELVFDLVGQVATTDLNLDIAEDIPPITSEDADMVLVLLLQQFQLGIVLG